MEKIEIKNTKKTKDGWEFLVEVRGDDDGIEYSVVLDKKYWEKLTDSKTEPEELIKKSFYFLLKRESKKSILRKFNLREINNYFSEYEKAIN